MTKTRDELFDRSIQERVLLAPCNAANDVLDDVQLAARGYWLKADGTGRESPLKLPGAIFRCRSARYLSGVGRPEVGEHNREVFVESWGWGRVSSSR